MEIGEDAKGKWNIGDKVCALLGGGGYVEYVAVKYDMCMPVPKNCSMIEAAVIPEAFATAYLNLFIEVEIKEGNTLLMHAGASGLASVIIPMSKVGIELFHCICEFCCKIEQYREECRLLSKTVITFFSFFVGVKRTRTPPSLI